MQTATINPHAYAWFPWAIMALGIGALVSVLLVLNRSMPQRKSLSFVGASSVLLGLYARMVL